MGKGNKAAKAANASTAPAATATPATVQVIASVKAGVNYRGARAQWYALLQQHVGQPASAYLAAAKATPPSLPKSGVAENPRGWLAYFVRIGTATLG